MVDSFSTIGMNEKQVNDKINEIDYELNKLYLRKLNIDSDIDSLEELKRKLLIMIDDEEYIQHLVSEGEDIPSKVGN